MPGHLRGLLLPVPWHSVPCHLHSRLDNVAACDESALHSQLRIDGSATFRLDVQVKLKLQAAKLQLKRLLDAAKDSGCQVMLQQPRPQLLEADQQGHKLPGDEPALAAVTPISSSQGSHGELPTAEVSLSANISSPRACAGATDHAASTCETKLALNKSAGLSQDIDDDELCAVCLEVAPEVVFVPCGHAVTCQACAGKVIERTGVCPLCRCSLQDCIVMQR